MTLLSPDHWAMVVSSLSPPVPSLHPPPPGGLLATPKPCIRVRWSGLLQPLRELLSCSLESWPFG